MKIKSTILITSLALAASALLAQAQDQNNKSTDNNNDPNRSHDRGGSDRGRFDYEDFRKQMNERMKAALKVTDDEWGALQPLIEKVQTKQRDAMGSRGYGGPSRGPGGSSSSGGSGSNGGGSSSSNDPNRPERAGSAQRDALRAALENENASPEELKAKLAAVRDIKQKSAAELAEAREELKKVLTVRQEATLVVYGILE